MDGMTGISPDGLGVLADPVQSAWRVVVGSGSGYVGIVSAVVKQDWQSGFLLSGLGNTGTGQALDMRAYQGAGYVQAMASGCSASASLLVSYNSASWFPISSLGLAVNGTATAQLSGMYPFLAARVDNAYNDLGLLTAITAVVWMHVTKAA
jgi:hypothetical protein